MSKEETIREIEKIIRDEQINFQGFRWAEMAARKIYSSYIDKTTED
jgi:hypothetical protein